MGQVISFRGKSTKIRCDRNEQLEQISKTIDEIDAIAVSRYICQDYEYKTGINNSLLKKHDRKEFEKWSKAVDDAARMMKHPRQ